MGFDKVPSEIVDQICELVPLSGLQNLRLVCRRVGGIAAIHVFRRAVVTTSASSLEKLGAIANHTIYSHHVRELFHASEFIILRGSQLQDEPLTFYEYVGWCRELENTRIAEYHRGYRTLPEEPRRLKPSQLKANYEVYKRIWEDQHHVLRCRHDAEVLTKLLPKLPNLTSFIVQDLGVESRERVGSLYLRELSVNRYGPPAYEALRKAKVLADAIVANSINPTRFCHDYLHHLFFDPRVNKNTLDGLIPLLGNLTHFEIGIRVTSEEYGLTSQLCTSTLRQHALQAMVAAMGNLEVLGLSFSEPFLLNHGEPMSSFCAAIHDIIPAHQSFARLKRLCLSGVETTADELVGLYTRHRDTLRVLRLANISLAEGSWYDLLPALKGVLGRETIQEIGFEGAICFSGPNEGKGGWWLDASAPYRMRAATEVDYEDVAVAPSLGQRLVEYLLSNEETELPLNWRNSLHERYFPMSDNFGEEHFDLDFWTGTMERIMRGREP
ncbi:hypothetical protein QBC34DRAFT_475209 [Podospora aff. communis PSN243]|uniref:F-box domain-containing protein n=1 Tax=Podospora aff. communis PSN243 TaxID=3040156 RepID=A0AAV9G7W4_9PEZI|nr:hypothetical protein QBC34DRAFT_475209 [Podospora aff. communis PSN243]